MAILRSCCFWKSLRKGAYASAVYTFFYYGGIFIMEGEYLYMERDFITGNIDVPKGESFLEREKVSYSSVIFRILLFLCSACGLIACILVFYGLTMDQRRFLVPWIVAMFLHLFIELIHFIYLIGLETLQFEPITAILYTIDFFLLCLNIYCLLCIISQYQQYMAGQGYDRRTPNGIELQAPPQTANLNYQKNSALNSNDKLISKSHAHANSIYCANSINKNADPVSNISPTIGRRKSSGLLKKHVQFPEDFKCFQEEEEVLCATDSNGNGNGPVDSPPSININS